MKICTNSKISNTFAVDTMYTNRYKYSLIIRVQNNTQIRSSYEKFKTKKIT